MAKRKSVGRDKKAGKPPARRRAAVVALVLLLGLAAGVLAMRPRFSPAAPPAPAAAPPQAPAPAVSKEYFYAGGRLVAVKGQGADPGTSNADTGGVFRPGNGALYLRNSNSNGFADIELTYGLAGDYPVAGDWNGDGVDTIGVYRNGTFYLRNSNTNGVADVTRLGLFYGQVLLKRTGKVYIG